MIFNKSVIYPYPIYTNSSLDYVDPLFNLEIELLEVENEYVIEFKVDLESKFVNGLMARGLASMYIVIKSFTESELVPFDRKLRFEKEKLDLGKKIRFQLYVISDRELTFKPNNELDFFYRKIKDQIILKPNMLLGMSNIVNFNGQIKKPFELFSWKFNPELDSEIKIELATDEIIIHHREKEYRYRYNDERRFLNNHYIYLGLQRALLSFFQKSNDPEFVDLEENSEELESSELDFKLITFLKVKKITRFSITEIDSVISQITDGIIDKQAKAIRKITNYAD